MAETITTIERDETTGAKTLVTKEVTEVSRKELTEENLARTALEEVLGNFVEDGMLDTAVDYSITALKQAKVVN